MFGRVSSPRAAAQARAQFARQNETYTQHMSRNAAALQDMAAQHARKMQELDAELARITARVEKLRRV